MFKGGESQVGWKKDRGEGRGKGENKERESCMEGVPFGEHMWFGVEQSSGRLHSAIVNDLGLSCQGKDCQGTLLDILQK